MITVYVLIYRESHELFQEAFVDCSMLITPMFSEYSEAENYRRKLSCAAYLTTFKTRMTERRYHELSGTR